ncbi:MAG: hypothetical protein M3Y71_19245 [Actinomycetota bacterium]|nr:hypothetical protein [Actinomycetota bacterium]
MSTSGLQTRPSPATVVARLPHFLPCVLLAYAACRLLTGVLLAVVAGHQVPTGWNGSETDPVTYLTFTAQWDGQWYQRIATRGYPAALPVDSGGVTQQNPWAFYPLFPLLARVLMSGLGLSFFAAGSTLSLVLGFVAAGAMAVLLRQRLGERAALLVVVVWACFPASAVLQVGYSESTAMALLTLVLLALSRERWLWAAGLAVLTGLARPIALPLAAVVVVALWLRWRRRDVDPLGPREVGSGLAALAGCGVAGLLWPVIAWWGTGRYDAYTDTMGAWRAGHEIHVFRPWLDMSRYYFGPTWGPVWLTTIFVVIAVMVLGPWARGLGPQLRAWSLAYPAYLLVVLDPFTSVFRYLIPLFPLVAVLVGVAGPRRRWAAVGLRAGVVLVAFVVGQWYWIDLLWRFVPPTDFPP